MPHARIRPMNDATYAGGLPPAGWYPDPEVPGQHRWWDGYQWYARVQPAGPRPLGGGFRALSWTVVGLLVASSVIVAGVGVLAVIGLATVSADPDASEGLAWGEIVAMLIAYVAMVGCMIAWCIWQVRLACAAQPGTLRRAPGWHAGSWFVPVVGLWWPLQNLADLWRCFVGPRTRGLIGLWWTGFLGMNIAMNVWSEVLGDGGDITNVRGAHLAALALAGLWIATASAAIGIVHRLTSAAIDRQQSAARLAA